MFKLVIQDDEGKTTVVPLIRDEITIGRKEGNTIRLTERNVSRRHARIVRSNGEVQIEDLGSYNGIRVNNARIAERVSLRVSDQVQIGDYKLYLKAEGVEQVDDARTMPIERVDTANTATDVIPAVAAPAPAPTVPMSIQTPAPGTLPPVAQMIGSPARTQVAVADTDPQGRPVASAAQVAAVLSSPAGYGKLVVLSSNFAGKEFELSRPQMIIGRTDENDIVVNHRSISRNHAKLVREPDTSRYTISDLQSSNGVRVNGQDYGKVELRRGDVVDLGHVRLRFVEAGEDFVFARDAVITDVPDSGSKKSLMIAVVAAVVVVIAVVAVMVLRGGGENKGKKNGSNDNIAIADASDKIAMTPIDAPDEMVVEPKIDGSNATITNPPTEDTKQLLLNCNSAREAKKWNDLITCGEQLRAAKDKSNGDKFYNEGHEELKNENHRTKFDGAIKSKSWKTAKAELDQIGEESVYKKDADSTWDTAERAGVATVSALLRAAKKADCKAWNDARRQAIDDFPGGVIAQAVKEVPCQVKVETPPVEKCKPDELLAAGQDAYSNNNWGTALSSFEALYRCKPDANALKFVFASACKSRNEGKARTYWCKMNKGMQDTLLSICVGNGITIDKLVCK